MWFGELRHFLSCTFGFSDLVFGWSWLLLPLTPGLGEQGLKHKLVFSPPSGHFDLLILVLNSCYRHPEQVCTSLCGLFFFICNMRKLYHLWGPFKFSILSPLWNYLFVLGLISTVVKMFTSPLSPPHVRFCPFPFLTSSRFSRKEEELFWGNEGRELLDPHSLDIRVSSRTGGWVRRCGPNRHGPKPQGLYSLVGRLVSGCLLGVTECPQ